MHLAQQSEFRLMLNLSENCNDNPNLIWINKIQKTLYFGCQDSELFGWLGWHALYFGWQAWHALFGTHYLVGKPVTHYAVVALYFGWQAWHVGWQDCLRWRITRIRTHYAAYTTRTLPALAPKQTHACVYQSYAWIMRAYIKVSSDYMYLFIKLCTDKCMRKCIRFTKKIICFLPRRFRLETYYRLDS